MATKNIEPFYPQLGRRLCEIRENRRLTQAQVGNQLSRPLSRAAIANIETGKQRVLAHVLVELARILDVDLGEILSRRDTRRETQPDIERDLLARRVPEAVARELANRATRNNR